MIFLLDHFIRTYLSVKIFILVHQRRSSLLPASQKEIAFKYYHYLKGKRYSIQTIKVYGTMMVEFLLFYGENELIYIQHRTVEEFCEQVIIKRGLSISYQRQFIGAFKLFCKLYSLQAIDLDKLERPKKVRKLPVVLSAEEVLSLLSKTRNLKHRMALALIYSAGLRIGELIQLELKDIDLFRRQINIRQAKGKKDRYVVLPRSFQILYEQYLNAYSPKRYVIEGLYGSTYSSSSLRKVLKRSCRASGIQKQVTLHTLRHSYATHLLENGVDLRYIQELLGHSKPETTMIYTHVARKDLLQIKSPLDMIIANRLKHQNDALPPKKDNY